VRTDGRVSRRGGSDMHMLTARSKRNCGCEAASTLYTQLVTALLFWLCSFPLVTL
jgi:hypothetical protein